MLESKGNIEQAPHPSFLAFLARILVHYHRVWPASGRRSSVCSTIVALRGAGGSEKFQATAKISEGFPWHQIHLSW